MCVLRKMKRLKRKLLFRERDDTTWEKNKKTRNLLGPMFHEKTPKVTQLNFRHKKEHPFRKAYR